MKNIILLLSIVFAFSQVNAQCTNPNITPCNVTVGGSLTLSSGTLLNLNGQVISPANGGTGSTASGSSGQYLIWNNGTGGGQWTTIAPYFAQSDSITKVVTLTQFNTGQAAKLGVSSNAVSATKLVTARTINGVSFDGTSNISIPVSASLSAPTYGLSITSGTAFQPNASNASFVTVSSTLNAALGVTGTVTIALSPTSGGTYTTVSTDALLIAVLGVAVDKISGTIPVPAGYYVKVTYGGLTPPTGTYSKITLQ